MLKSTIKEKSSAHRVKFDVSLTGSDIVESNPGKFRLGESELKERKDFVERTRSSVQVKCDLISSSMYSMFCVRLSSLGCLSGLRVIISRTFILEFLPLVTCKHCLKGWRCDLAATVFHTKTQTVPQTKSKPSGQLILLFQRLLFIRQPVYSSHCFIILLTVLLFHCFVIHFITYLQQRFP